MNTGLENYCQLVEKVDALCKGIEKALAGHIACREGCSGCCKAITLFPVEAAALIRAINELPDEEADAVRRHVSAHAGEDTCPLLRDSRCLLYDARPVICRTHGLPILFTENGDRRVDYCPLNLQECKSLPGSSVIDLDRLNELLVTVNSHYLQNCGDTQWKMERIGIAEAVLGNSVTSVR